TDASDDEASRREPNPAQDVPGVVAPPSAPPVQPSVTPQATPTPTPTPPPATTRPVTVSWILPDPALVPTPITGTGTPQGDVIVLDEVGRTVATAEVGEDGRFSVLPDPDALHQGMSVSIRHIAPTGEVTASAAVGPVVFATPSLAGGLPERFVSRTDADGDGEEDDVELAIEGVAGASVSMSLGRAGEGRIVLDDGIGVVRMLDVSPGLRILDLRYIDQDSGAQGLVVSEPLIVRP
ncbi:Ig-like domain-containing protein, partial [Microbacterium sp. H83]|uniref:Ig-like domain-containing protein n=1 Tax=Microbacterium sp. H83 TaxID=1827324 RepID=UPI000AE4B0FB